MARRSISLRPGLLFVACCACFPIAGAQVRSATDASAQPAQASREAHVRGHGTRDMRRARPVSVADLALPDGRDITALTAQECRRLLDEAEVAFEPVPEDAAPSVLAPVYLRSAMNGVTLGPQNGVAEHGLLDCRLAIALLAWSPVLHDAGVVRVEHYASFRPGARVRPNGKSSGHARALAIDVARFVFEDGHLLDIERDWEQRERGGAPCPERDGEGENGTTLRHLVCAGVASDLFQVVITPHHDRAHQNHVHLELVPEVEWSYVK